MAHYSDDSSDSEKTLFSQKSKLSNTKLMKHRKSEKVSTAHGNVVSGSPGKKSPIKQSRKSNDPRGLESPISKNQVGPNNVNENCYSSEDELGSRPNTVNIKVERNSSDGESEDAASEPCNTKSVRQNLFNTEDDEKTVDRDESMNAYDSDEIENSFYQNSHETSTKRHMVSVKKEIISSEDEETASREDPDKIINQCVINQNKILSGHEKSKLEPDGSDNSSDSEIQPSQFWLSHYKEVEKNEGTTATIKMSKLSPIKNVISEENVKSNRQKESQKKSPPRITKTEIISIRCKRFNQKIEKVEDDSSRDYDSHENISAVESKDWQGFVGLVENSDNDESDENVVRENKNSQGSRSGRKLQQSPKKQSPKKMQSSPKRKLSLQDKILDNDSKMDRKVKVEEPATMKRNLSDTLNDRSVKIKPNIYDNDTIIEELEERVERQGTSKNYVLALEKPTTSGKKSSNSKSTQMLLVLKSNSKILKNNESNIPEKRQLSLHKSGISHDDDANDEYVSEDKSISVAPGSKIESPKRKKPASDSSESSDEAETSVAKMAISHEQQTIKHRPTTGSEASPKTLKRKFDSDESSSDREILPPRTVVKTPLRRKHLDSDPAEIVSNKRAKLMSTSKQPSHDMSDSDETDSLTKLNTTLNKSMAFMESKSEIVKLNKTRKSVSINTKQNLTYKSNEARTQKSILKKSEQPATDDNNDNESSGQEQNVSENNQSVVNVTPNTIKRPLNLRELKQHESLAYDSTKASFRLDDISNDDEIYIMDVPRTIDPKKLKGQTIKLGGKNKLQIGNQLYETCGKDLARNISCVFATNREQGSYKIVNIRSAGSINVRQKLLKSSHIELSPCKKRTVPFPEKLKIRHPLFGAAYEDKIIIADKKVSQKTFRSPMKVKSKAKVNEVSKIEKRPMKVRSVEKHEHKRVDRSQEFNKSDNNCRDKIGKTRQLNSNDSASNSSDSDGSFFEQMKCESVGKHEKRKNLKNLSSILNLDETPSTIDLPLYLQETVIAVKQQKKNNKFFSSTPIKIEKDESNDESEILPNEVKRRKIHSDVGRIKSSKKVKTN